MRLTTIVLVAAASIFACCEGASAVSSSESLAFPQSDVQTENNGNRFLRVHHDTEEERAGPQLTKSLSEKFVPKTAALTRSKSLSELSKMDDAAYLKAIRGQHGGIFQLIENKGFNPDGMLMRMKELDGIDLTLLKHYTKYWMAKYPTWTSSL